MDKIIHSDLSRMTNPLCSMRHCIMKGYNDTFQEKANMFSEHLRDGDLVCHLILLV